MKNFFETRLVKWLLAIATGGIAIAFAVTGFSDTAKSVGMLFAIAMQAIPILACAGFTYFAITNK